MKMMGLYFALSALRLPQPFCNLFQVARLPHNPFKLFQPGSRFPQLSEKEKVEQGNRIDLC